MGIEKSCRSARNKRKHLLTSFSIRIKYVLSNYERIMPCFTLLICRGELAVIDELNSLAMNAACAGSRRLNRDVDRSVTIYRIEYVEPCPAHRS